MRAGGRILRFAMLGLAVTAAFASYQLIADVQPLARNSALMLVFVVLCPPSLLSLLFIGVAVGSRFFYFLWTIIGLLNAALYATVRALIARRQK